MAGKEYILTKEPDALYEVTYILDAALGPESQTAQGGLHAQPDRRAVRRPHSSLLVRIRLSVPWASNSAI